MTANLKAVTSAMSIKPNDLGIMLREAPTGKETDRE